MNCPRCQAHTTRVVDSRETEGGTAVRRRRVCTACDQRFTTYERIEELVPVAVSSRTGELIERRPGGRSVPAAVTAPAPASESTVVPESRRELVERAEAYRQLQAAEGLPVPPGEA